MRDLCRLIGVARVQPADGLLAELCASAGPGEVARACERIHVLVDPDGAEPDPGRDFAKRELVFSRCGSMLYIRGRLDAEGGAALQTAVDALMRPPASFDARTAPQRRADALVDLARGALAGEHLPQVGGERAHIGLLITPDLLFGTTPDETVPAGSAGSAGPAGPVGAGGDVLARAGVPPLPERPWLNWIGEVSPQLAQRLACDGAIWRLVVDPRTGMPLDVGNKHRFVPWWMRKALWARDRQCRFPGCDMPCEWTDAHHVVPWWRLKNTDIAGIVSLCRYHHTLVHEGGWSLAVDHTTGEVGAIRPGGSPYELPPSRPWTSPSRQGPRPRTAHPPRPTAA